ncbi:hypothetical protein [Bradyrhizobium sp. BR 1432]|uniref:hypothetical protein n=1 Tax=Bradyrhizobium sp. BR 1432 TaxID=3447966 RepID=UPI003EE66F90
MIKTDSGASLGMTQGYTTAVDRHLALLYAPSAKSAWRLIPQIDKHPGLVAYVQGLRGRLVLLAVVAALAAPAGLFGIDLTVAPLAMVCGYAQKLRRYLIPLATLLVLCRNGFWIDRDLVQRVAEQEGLGDHVTVSLLCLASLVLVIILCSCLLLFWQRVVAIQLFRRSTLCLISGFIGLVVVAESSMIAGMPRILLWSFLMALHPYLWFLAYALADAAAPGRAPFWHISASSIRFGDRLSRRSARVYLISQNSKRRHPRNSP